MAAFDRFFSLTSLLFEQLDEVNNTTWTTQFMGYMGLLETLLIFMYGNLCILVVALLMDSHQTNSVVLGPCDVPDWQWTC